METLEIIQLIVFISVCIACAVGGYNIRVAEEKQKRKEKALEKLRKDGVDETIIKDLE